MLKRFTYSTKRQKRQSQTSIYIVKIEDPQREIFVGFFFVIPILYDIITLRVCYLCASGRFILFVGGMNK